jgi:hypothetical protein
MITALTSMPSKLLATSGAGSGSAASLSGSGGLRSGRNKGRSVTLA